MHYMSRPFVKPVPITEQQIQHQCLEFLRRKYGSRAFVRKVPVGPMKVGDGHSTPSPLAGMPDLLICLGGRFIGVEIKLPGGKLSPVQVITHDAIREADGTVHVVHSLEECMRAFEGVK